MPTVSTIPTFHVFNAFPRDIGLAIFENCSPADLAELAAISNTLRELINSHPYLWATAQRNISRGDCPPVPACPEVEASGNFSQVAYARWLFLGGECSQCSKQTTSLPMHFVLRFRSCSASCKRMLLSKNRLFLDFSRLHDDAFGKWLPRLAQIDPLTGFTCYVYDFKALKTAKVEKESAIVFTRAGNLRGHRPPAACKFKLRYTTELTEEYARRERSWPVLEQNADELSKWAPKYLQEKEKVAARNIKFMKSVLHKEHGAFRRVQHAPTMQRLLDAFSRDLTLITENVWKDNRATILAEVSSTIGVPRGKVRCQFCKRCVSESPMGMVNHVVDFHKDLDPDVVVGKRGMAHCRRCPGSKRLFSKKGLEHHVKARHRDAV